MVNEMLASTYSLLGRSLAVMTANSVLHSCIDTKPSRIPYGRNELAYMWSRFLLRQRCLLCLCAESRGCACCDTLLVQWLLAMPLFYWVVHAGHCQWSRPRYMIEDRN
jgi:hypothetical protein